MDVREAMAHSAAEFFGRPTEQLEVAAVTGTNGKTTTSFLLYSILEAAGRKPGLLGTIESRVGNERRAAIRTTPEGDRPAAHFPRDARRRQSQRALEATSHGSEQKRLLEVRFAVLVFTNLSQDHLDFHGTMEAYARRSDGCSSTGFLLLRSTSEIRTAGSSPTSCAGSGRARHLRLCRRRRPRAGQG